MANDAVSDDDGALPPYPEPLPGDIAAVAAEAAAGLIPVAGGALSPLIAATFGSRYDRRQAHWIREFLVPLVEEMSTRLNCTADELAADDVFVTAVLRASRDSLGTHLDDKLQMFRNVLEHHVLDPNRGNVVTLRFLRWVDELEPDHVLVLTYAADPSGWYGHHALERSNFMAASRRTALEAARIEVPPDVLSMVITDLQERGLVDAGSLGAMVTGGSVYDPWITPRGHEWMRWVQNVEQPDEPVALTPP